MGTDPQIGSFHELRWLVTALKARAPTVLYEEAVDKMDPIHRRYRTDDDPT